MNLVQPMLIRIVFAAVFAFTYSVFGGSAFGQAHVNLTLERSADLIEWDPVTITDTLLTPEGLIEQSAEEGAGFFRLRISGGDGDSSFGVRLKFGPRMVEEGKVELELERTFDLENWHRLAVTPDLLAVDGTVVQGIEDPTPSGFVRIPAGTYARGDNLNETESWMERSRPVHEVYVSEFFLAKTPVTYREWEEVRAWAVSNGYSFDNLGQRGSDAAFEGLPSSPENDLHPVVRINWYDMVKWCNARSEMEGLDPVYYTGAMTSVYRSGREDISNEQVDWTANGYRLPTLAESEKAARGGLEGKRWPWGSEPIDGTRANYRDRSDTNGTTRVGIYPPNDYVLYDMAGNVWERCWDWFDANWYGEAGASAPDPRGPDSGIYRAARGGSWNFQPEYCRSAYYGGSEPETRGNSWGFRVARTK